MRKLEHSILIPSIIIAIFILGFIISLFFPFCIAEVLGEDVWLSYSGRWVIFDSIGNVLSQGKYTSVDGFPVASYPLLITAGIFLMGGFPSLIQANRNQRMSRESQVVLLVIFRFIFVLSGILGFTAVMLLLNFINGSSWDTNQLTFGYYFITITFGITTLLGLLRLFMRVTFQDEEEEYSASLREVAKLIVFDKSMENFEGELSQRVTEQLKQSEVVPLFEEILNQLRYGALERNKLEVIAQPFIYSFDVEDIKKCSSIVANIGDPIKSSSAGKLVEIIARGLLEKKDESVKERKTSKVKVSDKMETTRTRKSSPVKTEDKKQEFSDITKKEIDIIRKLIENRESVDVQWIEEETGLSKTKIKLIALELNIDIRFGKLVKKQ